MKMNELSLVLVGAGKMGGAMLTGWLDMDLEAKNVTVIDPGQPEDMKAACRQMRLFPSLLT